MKTLGYDKPLYILPFDHRGSFVTKMFGWHGDLTPAQTSEITAAKVLFPNGLPGLKRDASPAIPVIA